MKTNKVLFITRKYPPETGGMENLCFNVADNLPSDEFEVKVVALGKKQIHLLWFFPYALLYVLFHVKHYDYLLVGDGLMCMCGTVCRWFAHNVKRVVILHGLDITYKNPIYQFYLKLFLKKSFDLFICNSRNTQKIAKDWGITGYTTVITPGINTDVFSTNTLTSVSQFRKKYNIPDDDMILITVGRLIKRKGVAWFVESIMSELKNVTYLVVGEGSERETIERHVEEKKLDKKVKLLGRISDKDWKECYQNADVFVMPNIHVEDDVEGFGIVAAEASLAGMIVVASNIDGIPDAIQHEKNGILVESENADAFLKVLVNIQDDLENWKRIAKDYSEFTRKNFSWVNICEEYRCKMKQLKIEGDFK
ncbi:MAG: glycosyltransferase family 4 protein [Lachnospiraceae bacterium]|nr:glycosyltransferase family 4 protein [Lachnospiraceae bacterium]